MNSKKGAVFVEAALVLPMIMIISALIINLTITYYKEISAQAENHQNERYEKYKGNTINNGECEFVRRVDLFLE